MLRNGPLTIHASVKLVATRSEESFVDQWRHKSRTVRHSLIGKLIRLPTTGIIRYAGKLDHMTICECPVRPGNVKLILLPVYFDSLCCDKENDNQQSSSRDTGQRRFHQKWTFHLRYTRCKISSLTLKFTWFGQNTITKTMLCLAIAFTELLCLIMGHFF